jgi:hypothetical protein
LVGGLVQHELVSPSIQVRILSIVDETGSATIGEIADALPDHPDPVGAVAVMIRLGILVAELRGVLDASTILRRADPDPDPAGAACTPPAAPAGDPPSAVAALIKDAPVSGLLRLDATPFSPLLVVGPGSRRGEFGRMGETRHPGIYGLMSRTHVYIGTSNDTGRRVATGAQPISNIETIFVLTDANGNLTAEDAKVAERIAWSRAVAFGDRTLANDRPDGGQVDAQRYSEIDHFVAAACLKLRHDDLLFTRGTTRNLMAGPRGEPGRVGAHRPLNDIPDGEVLELSFNDGHIALAAKQAEDRWLLLRGSDVRIDTVATSGVNASFQRAAWLHSGLLDVDADGRSYVVMRDIVFPSGSAVAHFCTGSKGRGLAGWQPIDPDGGHDPGTAALIAH